MALWYCLPYVPIDFRLMGYSPNPLVVRCAALFLFRCVAIKRPHTSVAKGRTPRCVATCG